MGRIDLDRLLFRIRAEAHKGQGPAPDNPDEFGGPGQAGASSALEPLSASLPFEIKEQGYKLEDFQPFHDREFIRIAYLAILGRKPDPDGMDHYLSALRTGAFSKTDILGRIRYSREGRARGVRVKGLFLSFLLYLCYSGAPVIGRVLRTVTAVWNVPFLIKENQRKDSDLYILKERLDGHLLSFSIRLDDLARSRLDIKDELILRLDEASSSLRSDIQEMADRVVSLRRSILLHEREGQRSPCGLNAGQTGPETPLRTSASPPGGRSGPSIAETGKFHALYAGFEDRFRGLSDHIGGHLKLYLPLVFEISSSRVDIKALDLGCGRGEWLELMRENGIEALGVEINSVFAHELREKGLEAVEGDVFAFMAAQPDDSFNLVTAFHLIEHLSPPLQIALLDEICRVLRPDGLAILETPNPRNILVGAGDFYRDPDHLRPVFPDTLEFLGEARGFARSTAWFFAPGEDGLLPARSYPFDSLEDYVRVSRDFAWTGKKVLSS